MFWSQLKLNTLLISPAWLLTAEGYLLLLSSLLLRLSDSQLQCFVLFFPLPSFLQPAAHLDVIISPAISSITIPSPGGQRSAGAQPSEASAGNSRAHRAGELPALPAEGGGAGGGARGDAGRTQPQQRAGQGHGR